MASLATFSSIFNKMPGGKIDGWMYRFGGKPVRALVNLRTILFTHGPEPQRTGAANAKFPIHKT